MITWSCTSFCLVSIHQHDCHSSVCRSAYKPTCMPREGNMRKDKMREVRKSLSSIVQPFTPTKAVLLSFPRAKPQRYNEEILQQLCKSGTQGFNGTPVCSVEKMQEGLHYSCEICRGIMWYQYSEYRDTSSQKHLAFLMMKTKLSEGKTMYTVIFHF